MIIPVKWIYDRGNPEHNRLRGDASRVMSTLERMQELGDKRNVLRVVPYDGALITCRSEFGRREITIESPQVVELPPGGKRECICTCNFTVGFIIEELEEKIEEAILYDVAGCYLKDRYRLYKRAIASDYTKYRKGQKVILMPYNEMTFGCCTNSYLATGCKPIKSDYDFSSEDWRATVRVVPLCGINIPKWITNG